MSSTRPRAPWLIALLVATSGLACQDEPRPVKPFAAHLPSRQVVHTELHRRQMVEQLTAIRDAVKAADELPTLCRLDAGDRDDEAALPVTRRMLRHLIEPSAEIPAYDAPLNASAFAVLAEGARGVDPKNHELVMEAIDHIVGHRFLAVIQPLRHRAPARRGDRTVSPGRLEGELVLFDTKASVALCRGAVDASTSSSMNAYGDLDERAFAQDLSLNFLRAVEKQVSRATGGMKLAWNADASPRLASHGASSPSASPP